ncbi:unnamed protein product [Linum tenue]|uniref:Thaumatin-like protein n=1 Tax=Linum tenue TaxID=586396 RepID=A0AAV0LYS3_9ROSI|nr:unnamed protein product [Linum tenue]
MAYRNRFCNHLACILFTFCIAVASAQNSTTSSRTFTLYNNCNETIWPGIITKADHNDSAGDIGFPLQPGQTASYPAPPGWSGRIWGRTGCTFNATNGTTTGSCQTGSCGTSLNCTTPSSPPNTIAEFTLGDDHDLDFYDVSLVDGFNLPLVVSPLNGKGNCSIAGCDGDLRQSCPQELGVESDHDRVVACQSACQVFDSDEYCCRGKYSDPMVCVANNYSEAFKQVCPAASSYALDDRTTVMTCSASDYLITFCSSRESNTVLLP